MNILGNGFFLLQMISNDTTASLIRNNLNKPQSIYPERKPVLGPSEDTADEDEDEERK